MGTIQRLQSRRERQRWKRGEGETFVAGALEDQCWPVIPAQNSFTDVRGLCPNPFLPGYVPNM